MSVSHPLQVWRERKLLSQNDVAEMIGVERETVTRWENGTRRVRADLVPVVAQLTGISPARLRPDLAALFLEVTHD